MLPVAVAVVTGVVRGGSAGIVGRQPRLREMGMMSEGKDVGLCARCGHMSVVRSGRGGLFYRCGLSDVDPRYPRYPRLPVLHCSGFAPGEVGKDSSDNVSQR